MFGQKGADSIAAWATPSINGRAADRGPRCSHRLVIRVVPGEMTGSYHFARGLGAQELCRLMVIRAPNSVWTLDKSITERTSLRSRWSAFVWLQPVMLFVRRHDAC